MKFRAAILFFPIVAFFVETASFPSTIKNTCGKTRCSKQAIMGMRCHRKDAQDRKLPGKCNTPDCSVCPVCAMFVFQPQYEWTSTYLVFAIKYRLTNSVCVSCYIPSVWKPPNGLSVSKGQLT